MKIKRIITIVFTVLAAGMAMFSGIMKLLNTKEVMDTIGKLGVGDHRVLLGSMEIVFALLFIFKPTFKLGFILLSCYFAGALATEVSHAAPLNAITPLVLIWIAAFLRDKYVFLPGKTDGATVV